MLGVHVVVAAVPTLAGLDDRQQQRPEEISLRPPRSPSHDWEDAVHEVRVAHRELDAVVGAGRDPSHGQQMGNPQRFGNQPVLRLHDVAPIVERELHFQTAVGRAGRVLEGGLRAAERIRADDKVFVGVQRPSGHPADDVLGRGGRSQD